MDLVQQFMALYKTITESLADGKVTRDELMQMVKVGAQTIAALIDAIDGIDKKASAVKEK